MKHPLDPACARSAKVALAARLEEIAVSYVPAGWQVVHHRRLSGWCCQARKLIKAPRPITRKTIQIFLHECAHARLHADGIRRPRHVEELGAEQWSLAKMREHGITVPRTVMRKARQHVADMIAKAENRGAKRIDPAARKFAGVVTEKQLRRLHTYATDDELRLVLWELRHGVEQVPATLPDFSRVWAKALARRRGRS